jgi:hypothetical protein
MTMDYGYVTVHVTTDAARFRGPATTLVGVAEHIVEMAVEVPAESKAHALEFLRDLEDATVAADGSSED